MRDRAGDTEHPRVFAGCHRRQLKSKLGPKNLSVIRVRREAWLADFACQPGSRGKRPGKLTAPRCRPQGLDSVCDLQYGRRSGIECLLLIS